PRYRRVHPHVLPTAQTVRLGAVFSTPRPRPADKPVAIASRVLSGRQSYTAHRWWARLRGRAGRRTADAIAAEICGERSLRIRRRHADAVFSFRRSEGRPFRAIQMNQAACVNAMRLTTVSVAFFSFHDIRSRLSI